MSLFVSSADAMSGNLTKIASKASLWTTTWPLWTYFEGNAHPNDPDPSSAVPIIWLRHDRSLGLMRGAACVLSPSRATCWLGRAERDGEGGRGA